VEELGISQGGEARHGHLIEGHTRTGALIGLVQAGFVAPDSQHYVWIGRKRKVPLEENGVWREVLRTEFVPFINWVIDHAWGKGDLREVGRAFLGPYAQNEVDGDDLKTVLNFAAKTPEIASFSETIKLAHEEWLQFINPS
jgi:hypothetical protein